MLWSLLVIVAHAETDGELALDLTKRAAEINQKAGRTVGAYEVVALVEEAAREQGVTFDGRALPPVVQAWRTTVIDARKLAAAACSDAESAEAASRAGHKAAQQRAVAAYKRGDEEAGGVLMAAASQIVLAEIAVREACRAPQDRLTDQILNGSP